MFSRANVKVTRAFSTKKLDNAVFADRTLKRRRDDESHQLMTPRAKVMVKVTMTYSTKKLIIWQCLRLEHLNSDGMLVLTSR